MDLLKDNCACRAAPGFARVWSLLNGWIEQYTDRGGLGYISSFKMDTTHKESFNGQPLALPGSDQYWMGIEQYTDRGGLGYISSFKMDKTHNESFYGEVTKL